MGLSQSKVDYWLHVHTQQYTDQVEFQKTVAFSSIEPKYSGDTKIKVAIWLQRLLNELKIQNL